MAKALDSALSVTQKQTQAAAIQAILSEPAAAEAVMAF